MGGFRGVIRAADHSRLCREYGIVREEILGPAPLPGSLAFRGTLTWALHRILENRANVPKVLTRPPLPAKHSFQQFQDHYDEYLTDAPGRANLSTPPRLSDDQAEYFATIIGTPTKTPKQRLFEPTPSVSRASQPPPPSNESRRTPSPKRIVPSDTPPLDDDQQSGDSSEDGGFPSWEDPFVDSRAVPAKQIPLGAPSDLDDDLVPWDDDEYDAYLDQHFASPVARSDTLDEIHPTLEAAAIRFRKASFFRKTLAAMRFKSAIKEAIREDRLRREAEKEIERIDIEKSKHTTQEQPLLATASADLLQIQREAEVEDLDIDEMDRGNGECVGCKCGLRIDRKEVTYHDNTKAPHHRKSFHEMLGMLVVILFALESAIWLGYRLFDLTDGNTPWEPPASFGSNLFTFIFAVFDKILDLGIEYLLSTEQKEAMRLGVPIAATYRSAIAPEHLVELAGDIYEDLGDGWDLDVFV